MPLTRAEQTALIRRLADALRPLRKHAALVAEADAATADNRGRPAGVSKLAPEDARRLLAEHGSAEKAAEATGLASPATIRRQAKA